MGKKADSFLIGLGKSLFQLSVTPKLVKKISLEQFQSSSDIPGLVALNLKDLKTKATYSADRWNKLSRLERWQHGGPRLDLETLALHLQIIDEAGGVILIARRADQIIGELELLIENHRPGIQQAFIMWMVVHPDYRQQNIGTQLVHQAKQFAQKAGATQLLTIIKDLDARQFFHIMGFRILEQEGLFSKPLQSKAEPIQSACIQQIPLEWKLRKHPPLGFVPSIGINYPSKYLWTYLRNLEQLYSILQSKAPLPQLWLLRENEKEAVTVDYQFLRIWLTEACELDDDFLVSVLSIAEHLSWMNGVTQLSTFARSNQFSFLKAQGYQMRQVRPVIKLSL